MQFCECAHGMPTAFLLRCACSPSDTAYRRYRRACGSSGSRRWISTVFGLLNSTSWYCTPSADQASPSPAAVNAAGSPAASTAVVPGKIDRKAAKPGGCRRRTDTASCLPGNSGTVTSSPCPCWGDRAILRPAAYASRRRYTRRRPLPRFSHKSHLRRGGLGGQQRPRRHGLSRPEVGTLPSLVETPLENPETELDTAHWPRPPP